MLLAACCAWGVPSTYDRRRTTVTDWSIWQTTG